MLNPLKLHIDIINDYKLWNPNGIVTLDYPSALLITPMDRYKFFPPHSIYNLPQLNKPLVNKYYGFVLNQSSNSHD